MSTELFNLQRNLETKKTMLECVLAGASAMFYEIEKVGCPTDNRVRAMCLGITEAFSDFDTALEAYLTALKDSDRIKSTFHQQR